MRRVVVLAAVMAALAIDAPGVSAQRRVFTTGTPAEIAAARARGLAHLQARIHDWGIETPDSLVVTRADVDELSRAHTRVQQYFRGIPVFGGEAIVHLREDGEVEAVADGDAEGGSWLGALTGKCAASGFLLSATDTGVVRVEVRGGALVETRQFPGTEPFVTQASRLLVGPEGLFVVDAQTITKLRIS